MEGFKEGEEGEGGGGVKVREWEGKEVNVMRVLNVSITIKAIPRPGSKIHKIVNSKLS